MGNGIGGLIGGLLGLAIVATVAGSIIKGTENMWEHSKQGIRSAKDRVKGAVPKGDIDFW